MDVTRKGFLQSLAALAGFVVTTGGELTSLPAAEHVRSASVIPLPPRPARAYFKIEFLREGAMDTGNVTVLGYNGRVFAMTRLEPVIVPDLFIEILDQATRRDGGKMVANYSYRMIETSSEAEFRAQFFDGDGLPFQPRRFKSVG